MVEVVYYAPTVPSVGSTVRYTHAEAFPEVVERCYLVTEGPPPAVIRDAYDAVHELDRGTIRNGRRAARIAEDVAADAGSGTTDGTGQTLLVTTLHYAPVLAGTLADTPWVVDVFDDPLQYALNNPRSHHRVTARLLVQAIDRADGVVHNYHPHAGRVMSDDPRFIRDGCPTDLIDPSFDPPDERLRCVWAGSPDLDRGMDVLLEGLAATSLPVTVDVFGDAGRDVTALAESRDVTDRVIFHGHTDHETLCESVGDAHVGLCVLPYRRDWYHSTPLKVREYLAGGTIPVASSFPGIRYVAEGAGVYTDPTTDGLVRTLERLADIGRNDPDTFVAKMERARRQAELMPVDESAGWFVQQCVSAGLGIELF